MSKTSVLLIQTIIFKTGGKENRIGKPIFSYERGSIEPGDSDSWQDMALQIPALPPSELQHCNNIQIKYFNEVSIGRDIYINNKLIL